MTPKEFYEWAVENGAEDYDIRMVNMDSGMICPERISCPSINQQSR